MGTPELEDLVDGVHWLEKNYSVDANRIGVYGGSYGGFMTLMALFRAPDVFKAGAALRPVTDWTQYNHEYTVEHPQRSRGRSDRVRALVADRVRRRASRAIS